MTRYRLDTLKGRVVAFTCRDADDYDDKHSKQYENTHFNTYSEALASLCSSLRYQVANAVTRYDELCKQRRKARRDLARTVSLLHRVSGGAK